MRRELTAAAATEGRAAGTAFIVRRPAAGGGAVPSSGGVSLEQAMEAVRTDLAALADQDGTAGEVFAAHLGMVEDPLLQEQLDAAREAGKSDMEALDTAEDAICALFAEIEDEYLRARVDDVHDVCRRIREKLSGADRQDPFARMKDGAVVVADELSPSDTARMDLGKVRGFVTARGSATSHVCIIARSRGIPALLGVDIASIPDGAFLLADADRRRILVDPTPEDLATTSEETAENQDDAIRSRVAEIFAGLHPETWAGRPLPSPDGAQDERPVAVYGNAGSLEDVRAALENGADGIGLFRTEFLFLDGTTLPDEEEQFAVYRDAARLCGEKPLVIRTLDVGGDKAIPALELPREENPFLGYRAVRVCLNRAETLFKPQLRAILRASAYGNVRILLPMVTSVEEVRSVRALLAECRAELDGRPFRPAVPVGVMIETPAAVLIADRLAEEADFFSIGTNDLTQYTLAADRGNPAVAPLYNPLHPAVLRAIALTVGCAHGARSRSGGIPTGVCGEMAADPVAARTLAALGVDGISLSSPRRIPEIRNVLRLPLAPHKP